MAALLVLVVGSSLAELRLQNVAVLCDVHFTSLEPLHDLAAITSRVARPHRPRLEPFLTAHEYDERSIQRLQRAILDCERHVTMRKVSLGHDVQAWCPGPLRIVEAHARSHGLVRAGTERGNVNHLAFVD